MLDIQFVIEVNKALGGSVLNENSLRSAFSSWHYYEKEEDQISSIVRGLIKNHSFTDANKRTALLVYLELCEILKKPVNKTSDELLKIILDIAVNQYSVEEVSNRLF